MIDPLVECSFPIPILRDSDRQPHQPHAWDDLTIELRMLVKNYPRGHQGPKTVFHWEEDVTPGAYEEGPTSGVTQDESRKYWIALPADKVKDLREMLRRQHVRPEGDLPVGVRSGGVCRSAARGGSAESWTR